MLQFRSFHVFQPGASLREVPVVLPVLDHRRRRPTFRPSPAVPCNMRLSLYLVSNYKPTYEYHKTRPLSVTSGCLKEMSSYMQMLHLVLFMLIRKNIHK